MNTGHLYKYIGTYDERMDCLYPGYLMYPEVPIYEIRQDEDYFLPLLAKHFIKVDEPQEGDLLVFKFRKGFHFGVYNEYGKFFHCCKRFKLRLSRLQTYQKSLKGIYRWRQ